MHLNNVGFLVIALTVIGLPAKAEACPLRLSKDVLQLNAVPKGWTPLLRKQELTLSAVGMLHGAYDGSGYLKPTVTKVRKAGGQEEFTSIWDFAPPPHYERWYFCEYGEAIELLRQVDVSARSCTIVSTREGNAITAMRIACTPADPRRR
ncbi:STY0301 family protein [Massilia soli]|uniref:Uncharacterized protein n=1 Tax=Massilia soli TaxID=2792854 RepID=A0ABS7STU3_9BURK|nr:hypothetical protein [Massilia soli]